MTEQHALDGHTVYVLASQEVINEKGSLEYLKPGRTQIAENFLLERLPYKFRFLGWVSKKLRIHSGVLSRLKSFDPDVIMFHGTCGWELLTVARYVRNRSNKVFYIDSHEDSHNSGRGFFSKYILHRLYYAGILRIAYRSARKILCYSTESIEFVNKTYGIPKSFLELYPLGGKVPDDEHYNNWRSEIRSELKFSNDNIVIIQTGKLNSRKRIIESLRAFKETNRSDLRLIICGCFSDEVEIEARSLIESDNRITFLGWMDYGRLQKYLCGSDIYLQPGTQSITMQSSLCCRCAIILRDYKSHEFYHRNNGWLIRDLHEVTDILNVVDHDLISEMSASSFELAKRFLDYKLLSRRILE